MGGRGVIFPGSYRHCQVREKGIRLRAPHLPRMAQLVKPQKPPQPTTPWTNPLPTP
jgi:hypothetical protein